MSGGYFTVYVTRADGRGSEWCGAYGDPAKATAACREEFERDHAVTMAWVLTPDSCTHGEPMLRDPPGMSSEAPPLSPSAASAGNLAGDEPK